MLPPMYRGISREMIEFVCLIEPRLDIVRAETIRRLRASWWRRLFWR